MITRHLKKYYFYANYLVKKFFVYLIRLYQIFISPLFPNTCRYYPSCSQYSIQAIEKYGVLKGLIKSVWRVLRCNPFSHGGYDPV